MRTSRLLDFQEGVAIGLICALALAACARPRVLVAPRVDLRAWRSVGLIAVEAPRGVGPQATARLLETLQAAQPGVAVLELGGEREVLASVGRSRLDFESVRALGERYRVDAVLVARIELGEAKPNLRVASGFDSLSAEARVNGAFQARLLRASDGATVWTTGSTGSRSVARVRAERGAGVALAAEDPADVDARLVQDLVYEATHELRPTWERR